MDPNNALRAIREICKLVNETPGNQEIDVRDVVELVQNIESLDNWLCNGGFLPKSWAKNWARITEGKSPDECYDYLAELKRRNK